MSIPEVTPQQVASTLDRYRIIDVREPHEYGGALGHIDGAESIPLAGVTERAADLAGDALLLVCRSGKRSEHACKQLLEAGASDATNLAGGMIAWNEAGLSIERAELASVEAIFESAARWLAQVTATPPDDGRARLLALAGVAADALGKEDLGRALASLESELREAGAPADLDLCIAAYCDDLAKL